jgi:hypothetical protein
MGNRRKEMSILHVSRGNVLVDIMTKEELADSLCSYSDELIIIKEKLAIAIETLDKIERCESLRVEKMPGGLSEIPLRLAREALRKIK